MNGREAVNSTILGAAAEHYVMCQLLRRGLIAALAPAGVPDADIIVSDRVGSQLAAVQVKARRDIGSEGGWHMRAKHEGIVRDLLFYCFVDFGKALEDCPKCWVLPSAVVAQTLRKAHLDWLGTPGKAGHVRRTATCAVSCRTTGTPRRTRRSRRAGSTATERHGNDHARGVGTPIRHSVSRVRLASG